MLQPQQSKAADLTRLAQSDLLSDWIDDHANGWGHHEWTDLVGLVQQAGLQVDERSLGLLCERLKRERYPEGLRQEAEQPLTIESIQTVDRVADGAWADPVEFAGRYAFEPGMFWIGRCPVSGEPVGHRDQKHILLVGTTRGGKGATIITPNELLWNGSMVTYDTKGENTAVTAARRGEGNDVCVGMGQFVATLDPMHIAKVDPKYRKRFNPLDVLDPEHHRFQDRASNMADAMVVKPKQEGDSTFWNLKARSLIRGLIMHVCTSPQFVHCRNLVTVYLLAMFGDEPTAAEMTEINRLQDEHENVKDEDRTVPIRPFEALFRSMQSNRAVGPGGNTLPAIANEMLDVLHGDKGAQWLGFRSTLSQHLEFLEHPGIQEVLEVTDEGVDLARLKTDPSGMSLFLCLPLNAKETYARWVRLMLTAIVEEMQMIPGQSATGHRTLMMLDEFASLGHMRVIQEGFSTLAGADVKMVAVLQNLGQLGEHYEKAEQDLLDNTGLQLFFDVGDESAKRISGWLGETDVVIENKSMQVTEQQGTSDQSSATASAGAGGGVSDATGTTENHTTGSTSSTANTEGDSDTSTESSGQTTGKTGGSSQAQSQGGSTSDGTTRGDGTNGGTNSGMTHEGMPVFRTINMLFAAIDTHTQMSDGRQDGWSKHRSRNRQRSKSWNNTASENRGWSDLRNVSRSLAKTRQSSSTDTHGKSQSDTYGRSATHTVNENWTQTLARTFGHTNTHSLSVTMGVTQNVQKRPLLAASELVDKFAAGEEHRDAHYPGFVLVRIKGKRPAVIRKTLYYDDLGFDGMYDRHPDHPETDPPPVVRRSTVLAKYPPEIELCYGAMDDDGRYHRSIIARWHKRPGEEVRKGEPLYALRPGLAIAHGIEDTVLVHAPQTGRILSIDSPAGGSYEPDQPLATLQYHLLDAWLDGDEEVADYELERLADGEHLINEKVGTMLRNRQEAARLEAEQKRLVEQATKVAAPITIELPADTGEVPDDDAGIKALPAPDAAEDPPKPGYLWRHRYFLGSSVAMLLIVLAAGGFIGYSILTAVPAHFGEEPQVRPYAWEPGHYSYDLASANLLAKWESTGPSDPAARVEHVKQMREAHNQARAAEEEALAFWQERAAPYQQRLDGLWKGLQAVGFALVCLVLYLAGMLFVVAVIEANFG
jgi:type IV secretion system protein VirD4